MISLFLNCLFLAIVVILLEKMKEGKRDYERVVGYNVGFLKIIAKMESKEKELLADRNNLLAEQEKFKKDPNFNCLNKLTVLELESVITTLIEEGKQRDNTAIILLVNELELQTNRAEVVKFMDSLGVITD